MSGFSRTVQVPSRLFPDTGYVVMRDNGGSHAVFDVGEHGYMNGGHAHADALSLTLSLEGRPFLVDPGHIDIHDGPAAARPLPQQREP